jgi:hypothetical protein
VTNNSHSYDGDQFSFPINQAFNFNEYFGGETLNVIGGSSFDSSTHDNVAANKLSVNYINNTYVGGAGRDGADGRAGADAGDGFAGVDGAAGLGGLNLGNPILGLPVRLPFNNAVTTYLRDVKVRGTVVVPTVTEAAVKDTEVTINNKSVEAAVLSSGVIVLPTVKSASVGGISSAGTITLPTVTGGTLAGATASGTVTVPAFSSATCGSLSGTVSIPTAGSISGATASGTLSVPSFSSATCSGLTGTVTIPAAGSISGATASGTLSVPSFSSATACPILGRFLGRRQALLQPRP